MPGKHKGVILESRRQQHDRTAAVCPRKLCIWMCSGQGLVSNEENKGGRLGERGWIERKDVRSYRRAYALVPCLKRRNIIERLQSDFQS